MLIGIVKRQGTTDDAENGVMSLIRVGGLYPLSQTS